MGLFKVPKRNNISTQKILDLVENEEVSKPKITLRGTSLSAKIQAIGEKMQADLGELAGDYLLLDTREKWLEYCSCAVDNGIVSIDTETAGLSFDDIKNIAGICIYTPNNKPAYAPIGHISTITEQLLGRQITKHDATDGIKMLKDNKVKTIFHNAYFDLLVIKLCTDIWMDIYWDTLPASFLLNENESHSLKYQYDKYVMHGEVGVHKFNDIIGTEIPMNYIPPNIAGVYSSFDPIMTFKLYEFQKPYLTKGTAECARYKLGGVADIFFTEELPIIPVLAEMKYRGTKIDLDIAEKLKVKYTNLRNKAKEEFNKSVEPLKCEIIHRMDSNHDIEYPINYNSPAQIKILIYDILKSGVIFKKEETGTGKHVLDTVLADKKYKDTKLYDIVKALVEVKKYDKALNTFIEKIIGLAKNGNGVIHSNFNSCAARCISGNSLILTDDGYLHMKDYIKASDDGQEITHNSNIVNRYGKYEQATHDYKYNNRNVITMYTRYGFVITGTHNHPVMSDNNTFKCLSEYAIGDYVYVPLGYDKFPCKYQELITDTGNHRIYGKSITVKDALPNVINEQVAELLGMYHADGSKKTSNGTYTLTISNHNPKVINRVLCLYKKLFGIDGYVDTQYNKTKHNNRSNIKISSIALCWLDNYTQRGAKNKRIPKEIMMSPKSVIFAYIRGLMLDSSYAKNKTDLVISIYNHDDAVFVQSVLANAGVLSSIRVNNATYSGYNGFRLSIVPQYYNKFMSLVEFNLYDYPNRLGIEKQRKYYKEVNGGVLLRVMKLEYSTCDVFDIHVPNTHSFISNAVVSHNTGRLSSSGDINYQQLPSKLGDIRNMFTAGSGEVLISCDIKKQEVVVASLISGDRKLQEALKSGLDVYSKIASIAFDNTYEDNLEFFPDGTTNKEGKARRASAKAVTLGKDMPLMLEIA